MRCPICKKEAVKIYDSRYSFRGAGKDDKDVFACPFCHSSFKMDYVQKTMFVSKSIDGKVGGKRITQTIMI